jgi:hypothetical protein
MSILKIKIKNGYNLYLMEGLDLNIDNNENEDILKLFE